MDRAAELVQIVDAAMAEAVRKAGPHLACRPGCAQCCLGLFPISQADAQRLRAGLADLAGRDPARAAQVRARAQAFVDEFGTSALDDDPATEDYPCPALDPATQTCDLYAHRPITCRTFGPAVSWGGDAVGICELCFEAAAEEEIAAAMVEIDVAELEDAVEEEIAEATGRRGQTLVASALVE